MNRVPRPALDLVLADESIVCELHRSRRGARNLTLRIRPDGSVRIGAPRWASLAEIRAFVLGHADWIVEERRTVARAAPRYTSGATLRLLGNEVDLVVRQAPGRPRTVHIGNELVVTLPDTAEAKVRARVLAWYRHAAAEVFDERGALVCASIDWLRAVPKWRQRRMRSQWGSCAIDGEITLNTNLVKAATHLIDYVIQHEVCHLVHHDHGKAFQHLMDRHMPDWRARRRELNTDVSLLVD